MKIRAVFTERSVENDRMKSIGVIEVSRIGNSCGNDVLKLICFTDDKVRWWRFGKTNLIERTIHV